MAGKWAHLRGQFPTLDSVESFDEKRRAIYEGFEGKTVAELITHYNDLRTEKQALDAKLKELNTVLDVIERVVDTKLEDQDLESVTVDGSRWTRSPEPYPNVVDKHALRAWAQEHMPDALNLAHGTLKSVVKDALDKNEPLPPGVSVYVKPGLSMRRS